MAIELWKELWIMEYCVALTLHIYVAFLNDNEKYKILSELVWIGICVSLKTMLNRKKQNQSKQTNAE